MVIMSFECGCVSRAKKEILFPFHCVLSSSVYQYMMDTRMYIYIYVCVFVSDVRELTVFPRHGCFDLDHDDDDNDAMHFVLCVVN